MRRQHSCSAGVRAVLGSMHAMAGPPSSVSTRKTAANLPALRNKTSLLPARIGSQSHVLARGPSVAGWGYRFSATPNGGCNLVRLITDNNLTAHHGDRCGHVADLLQLVERARVGQNVALLKRDSVLRKK